MGTQKYIRRIQGHQKAKNKKREAKNTPSPYL